MTNSFLVMLLTLCCIGRLSAQLENGLEKLSDRKYTDGVTTGKLQEFRHVFEADHKHLKLFDKWNRTRKTQRAVNYGTIAVTVFAIGNLVFNRPEKTGTSADVGAVVAYGGAILIGPLIMIVSNPIFAIVKGKRKRKLLNSISNDLGYDNNEMPDVSISFLQTRNGVGLTVTF